MLVVLMSAALWGVGAWQVVDGHTTLGAMCIFVGGGAFFVTVARLRHGAKGARTGSSSSSLASWRKGRSS